MADTDFGYVDDATGKVKALSLATPQPTERQRIGDEIKAAFVFAPGVIRPTGPGQLDATGVINSFIADGLFRGQSPQFMNFITSLAREADAAQRELA